MKITYNQILSQTLKDYLDSIGTREVDLIASYTLPSAVNYNLYTVGRLEFISYPDGIVEAASGLFDGLLSYIERTAHSIVLYGAERPLTE